MLRLLSVRLTTMVPLLAVVSLLIYALIILVPGDPAVLLAGQNPSPERVEAVRENLGLNDPFLVQYGRWVAGLLHGDLGRSYLNGEDVWSSILGRLPVTLSLVAVTLLFAAVLGLALGVVAGLYPGRWIDRFATVLASVGVALPYFWVGMMLVLLLAINTPALPATGYVPLTENPVEWFRHLMIPGLALAITPMAMIARQTRSGVAAVMTEDYIRTAEAKGLSRSKVIGKHALKNAAVPVVTVFGLEANRLIGATVVMEQLFVLPGLGQLAYFSVFARDFPMVQGVLVFTAVLVLLVNLGVDMSYGYFNPKIKSS